MSKQKKLRKNLRKILYVLSELYDEHEVSISARLDKNSLKEIYDTVIDEYKHALLLAEKEVDKFTQKTKDDILAISLEDSLLNCTSCANQTFVLDKEGEYFCTYCNHKDVAAKCEYCHKIFPLSEQYKVIENCYWCSEQCLKGSMKGWGCD